MQIVTDSGTDLNLSAEEAAEYKIHIVPLNVTLDGKTYKEGVDIEPEDFYKLLEASDNLPTTSQPPAGQFADLYRRLAADDPEILSIHMTSGLSGTYNSALAGAEMVPEANVTLVDTKTLSAAAGWQVEAAARTNKAGWTKDRILDLIKRIGDSCESVYTLDELKYLIHGGRISHMKGIIASLINIRIHVQVLHSFNPEGASFLREQIDKLYDCTWMPIGPMSLVLGAHTGPSMVGVGFGDQAIFDEIP